MRRSRDEGRGTRVGAAVELSHQIVLSHFGDSAGAQGSPQPAATVGGYVLGQDEATSDVYGMNKVAYQSGHVNRQFSLDDAATSVSTEVTRLLSLKSCGTIMEPMHP